MAKWNDLPNEIKTVIIHLLFDEDGPNLWRSVTCDWHDIYQSLHYKEINIDIDDRYSALVKLIFESSFQPGRWVETVNSLAFTLPESWDNIDLEWDSLYQFIRCCPNVIRINHISDDRDYETWSYFMTVMEQNDKWKLEYLAYPIDMDMNYYYYFECAYYMRKSLMTLKITADMFEGSNFDRLSGFENLKTLHVGTSLLQNVFDCDSIVQLLPRLERLTVKEFVEKNSQHDQKNKEREFSKTFSNMKQLELDSCTPSTDEELNYIMTSYPNLESLVFGNYSDGIPAWPVDKIQASTRNSFFTFISKLKTYNGPPILLNDL